MALLGITSQPLTATFEPSLSYPTHCPLLHTVLSYTLSSLTHCPLLHTVLSYTLSYLTHCPLLHTVQYILLTSMVFPFPGGPNSRRPLAGDLKPVNSWGMEDRKRERQSTQTACLLVCKIDWGWSAQWDECLNIRKVSSLDWPLQGF